MKQSKRLLVVSLIVLSAILLGVLLNFLWGVLEKERYPKEFDAYVEQYAEEYGVPLWLVYAVIKVESNFDTRALSPTGAMGLMQMKSETFLWLTGEEHLGEGLTTDSLYTPEVSIRYGVYYLQYLYNKFENWDLVIVAYNGGEGNVARWLENPEYSDKNGNLTYIHLSEPRHYLKKVKSAWESYENIYAERSLTANEKEKL